MRNSLSVLLFGGLIALCGCGGSNGAAGPAGAQGPAGASGGTDSVSEVIYCSKIDSGSGVSLIYGYQVSIFESGDVFVSCVVSGGNGQDSGSDVYKSDQVGASTAGCSVTADINSDNNFGYWSFAISGSTASTTYHDTGHAHDGYSYTFAAGDCSTH